jgi:hypothetical protein
LNSEKCDVANLAPVITDYFATHDRSLSYVNYGPARFEEWKQEARTKLIELVGIQTPSATAPTPPPYVST